MRSIEAGASGYLLKDSSLGNITAEIRSLHAGGSPISPLIARQILMRFRDAPAPEMPVPKMPVPGMAVPRMPVPGTSQADAPGDESPALSMREKEVLELISKGFTAEEIAGLLHVSRNTVLTFVRRIYAKLNVISKLEAIFEARTRGILPQ